MKKLLTAIALLILSCTTTFAQQRDSANHRAWSLVITPKTTKAYLDSVSSAWKANQITLTFSILKYKHGKLVKVSGSVATQWKKNVSGTFSSDNLKSIEIKVTDRPSIYSHGN